MREVVAYQAVDGTVYLSEKEVKEYEDDLLGQELDGLLRLFELDITRYQEYRGLLSIMKKRTDLLKATKAITKILEHGEEDAVE